MFIIELIFFVIFANVSILKAEPNSIITIPQGSLRGTVRTDRKGGTFLAFRSIPFAEPPIGPLRFMPPVPHHGWSGVLNATEDIPICFQAGEGQEDCLYLNVFTKKISPNAQKPLPVIVFFHGGGFFFMNGREDFYNPEYLLTRDIVVVSAAYRMGFLGFIALGENTAEPITANAGIKDQSMVLQWVHDNIKYFGGDQNSVTLMGESGSACGVHMHIFSPLSKGLFHKVILESSPLVVNWCVGIPGSGDKLAKELGISTNNLKQTLKELQDKDASVILEVQQRISHYGDMRYIPYNPIVEGNVPGAFLSEQIDDLFQSGNYSHVPILIGYNTAEGVFFETGMQSSDMFAYLHELESFILPSFNITNKTVIEGYVENIKKFYFNGRNPDVVKDAPIFVNINTDLNFLYCTIAAIKKHSVQNDRIYVYQFDADTQLNFNKKMNFKATQYKGASHMDELGYLFKNIMSPIVEPDSVENRMIDRMVDFWTNFAEYGNPTPIGYDLHWKRLSMTNKKINYFRIQNDKFSNKKDISNKNIRFWDFMFKRYGNAQ